MMIKKTLLCFTLAFLAGGFSLGGAAGIIARADSGENRVFDEAGLFTEQERTELQNSILAASEKIGMDVGVMTTDDAAGKTTEQLADNFYEENGLGTGRDHSGALCVIDMDNRQLYISTEGDMIRYLTDERIESIMDNAIGYVGDGEYAQGISVMLEDIKSYVAAGIVDGQYNYDRDTGEVSVYRKRAVTFFEGLIAFLAAGTLAVLPCISTVKKYKMESEKRQALNYHLAYRGASAFAFTLTNDLFINKMVSQRRINQNVSGGGSGRSGGRSSGGRSTVHRSGGGRSHGGGGRGF